MRKFVEARRFSAVGRSSITRKAAVLSTPSGAVLPGGGDWVLVRKDGVSQLDVRITLKCNDGSLIFVSYRGIADIPPDVRARIAKGEDVGPEHYYFRITPVFETRRRNLRG